MNNLPIIRPTMPTLAEWNGLIEQSWKSGTVTVGPVVRAFEEEAKKRMGVRHAVALSSCTAGLMLAPRALDLPPGSEVIVPSFTFAATAQALVWNGLVPVFCDCLPETCTLDPADVERNIAPKTAAICPVYIYGLPPDIDPLLEIGRRKGIPVYFDSAQGILARYKNQLSGGFGACEIFSFSPTKVVTAVEGGLVTTNDDSIAQKLRSMRDYGKDPETGEDMIHMGLSARMSELHAAVGLLSLRNGESLVASRLEKIARYRDRLGALPGCRVQEFPSDRVTSGNYFVLFITEGAKQNRDKVYQGLKQAGIQTKRYFFPPVHAQSAFKHFQIRVSSNLRNTGKISGEGLALPLYSHMTDQEHETVCREVEALLA